MATTDDTPVDASVDTAGPAQPTGVDEFAERLLAATLGAVDMLAVHLGDRLGWYRALVESGPLTSAALAEQTDTVERYAREWLEQQAASGIVVVADEGSDGGTHDDPRAAGTRAYALPQAQAEVLTDGSSLAYMAPLARFLGAIGPQLPHLLEAYRAGGGVSWEQLGDEARHAQADANRPWFDARLAPALAGVPAVHDVLSRPGARIIDVGCGFGWSTLALARAYPAARLHGVDIDAPSVAAASDAAEQAGLADRVTFHLADAAALPTGAGDGQGDGLGDLPAFDAAFAFECVHDMPQPVPVLDAVRRAVRPDGVVVVMDEAVGDELHAPADEVERLMYGYSLFVCLPDGLSTVPSVGTGTVMRPATLRRYAREAGYSGVEVLPIDDFSFFRFYRLTT